MALTLEQAREYAENPGSIPAGGGAGYGTGRLQTMAEVFKALKSGVQKGELTLTDYQGIAEPFVKATQQEAMGIGGRGSSAASAMNAIWGPMIQQGFISADGGKVGNPFSRTEYAKLPDQVLPTQEDVNKGLFDPTNAPLQRIRTTPTPAVNPSQPSTPAAPATPATPVVPPPATAGNNTTTTQGPETPNSQTGTAPIYTAAPNNPPPYGGLASTNAQSAYDAQRIAQEAALQQQLSTQSQEGVTAKRQQYLNDLSGLLVQQQQQQMSEAAPGIYEDLNSRGLLRSSELGNAMAREQRGLQAQTTNQLAQYGIQGQTEDLKNYTGIQNQYNQGRNSALSREFSVEDYNKQVQTGKEMGEAYAKLAPQAPSTKDQVTVAAAGGASTGLAAKSGKP